MADLTAHVTSPTVQAIYRWHESRRDDGHRAHLGASVIGRPCDREIWYGWRWWLKSTFDGRVLRLFETGCLAEFRFVTELRGIGATVWPRDPSTGRQWHVSAHGGHFGGSLDAVCQGIPESKAPHVCEFKTHGAKSFATLANKGVEAAKPEHFAQMQIYMHLMDLDRALYLAVNKDTDQLHAERVKRDRKVGESLLNKAERIIYAWQPPSRVSDNPEWWQCQLCDYWMVCHGDVGVEPDRNCRTCSGSKPQENGTWVCEGDGDRVLRDADQRKGCERWEVVA